MYPRHVTEPAAARQFAENMGNCASFDVDAGLKKARIVINEPKSMYSEFLDNRTPARSWSDPSEVVLGSI